MDGAQQPNSNGALNANDEMSTSLTFVPDNNILQFSVDPNGTISQLKGAGDEILNGHLSKLISGDYMSAANQVTEQRAAKYYRSNSVNISTKRN